MPDSLKKAVADALSLVNMDTVGAEERAAKYAALIAKEIPDTTHGEFGADMKVSLLNDGPVTIVMESDVLKKKK